MQEKSGPTPATVGDRGLTWKKFVLELPVPVRQDQVRREFVPLDDDPFAYFAQSGLRFLVTRLPAELLRDLGRALAADARPETVASYLAAWASAGLGHVAFTREAGDRFRYTSADLLLHPSGGKTPTCRVALGFLEGLTRAATGRDALGAEVECRAAGHAECVFVVMSRNA